MNSRDRIKRALSHNQPDKLPVDFGGMLATGIHVSTIYRLRQKLGLDRLKTPVKIIEPFQMLGEIKDDLKKILCIDTAPIFNSKNFFGFGNDNWKEWELHDGTPVLVPNLFNTKANKDGSIYMYPQGDALAAPAAMLPKQGFYFDLIIRQEKIDESKLNAKDNLEEFIRFSENEINYIKSNIDALYSNTNYAIIASLVTSGFGDIALVPGPTLKAPKGIRDISEWYISTVTRKDYVKKVFSGQMEIALENYRRLYAAVGNKIDIVFTTGTDFGIQNGLFISIDLYRELYKPFHKKINDWIHSNTEWHSFMHCCGSIYKMIPEFIEAGFDILNPVQISAKDMDPLKLKKNYGKYLTFWGGGVDTQKTLPFGTSYQIKEEVKKLINIFNNDGGFVFSSIHNIQANIPIENIIAMIEVIQEYRK